MAGAVLLAVLGAPLAASACAVLCPWRRAVGWLGVAATVVVLAGGVVLAARVVHGPAVTALGGALRVDALGAVMIVVVALVGTLACIASVRYLDGEVGAGHCSRRHAALYGALVQVFLAAMLLAVSAANLAMTWVAIEATTIATTFLVGHRGTRRAVEASWKYVAICSVGIATAFLGTVLVDLAALHAGHGPHASANLDWTALVAESPRLDPGVMRLAFALVVLGYGTKVGLAPMHSWLPDAHSQAPAPVSALMSGVLLAVAFYAVLRFKAVADGALGPGFSRALLVAVGLLSLAVAASLLVAQRDYKRMLAYSSIEHMGLVALGAAAGTPLAIAAVLLHIVGHGLTKAVLFLGSGEILATEKTSEIGQVRALLARRPGVGGLMGVGLFALLGLPPFSLFVSELGMIRAEVDVGLGWAAGIALALMAVVFAALTSHGRQMLLGPLAAGERPTRTPRIVVVPLATALVACALLGVVAWPLAPLLESAAKTVAR